MVSWMEYSNPAASFRGQLVRIVCQWNVSSKPRGGRAWFTPDPARGPRMRRGVVCAQSNFLGDRRKTADETTGLKGVWMTKGEWGHKKCIWYGKEPVHENKRKVLKCICNYGAVMAHIDWWQKQTDMARVKSIWDSGALCNDGGLLEENGQNVLHKP
jgi:hypothetical protein